MWDPIGLNRRRASVRLPPVKSSLRKVLRELGHWTVPGGVVLASVLPWIRSDAGTPVLREISEGYPLAVLGASLLLAGTGRGLPGLP